MGELYIQSSFDDERRCAKIIRGCRWIGRESWHALINIKHSSNLPFLILKGATQSLSDFHPLPQQWYM